MLNPPNNSLLTLGQINKENKENAHSNTKVFIFYPTHDKMHAVELNCDGLSTNDVILMAVCRLNKIEGINLKEDGEQYQLYAARKSGKKISDLPSI